MRRLVGTRVTFEIYAIWREAVEPPRLHEVIVALDAAAKKRLVG